MVYIAWTHKPSALARNIVRKVMREHAKASGSDVQMISSREIFQLADALPEARIAPPPEVPLPPDMRPMKKQRKNPKTGIPPPPHPNNILRSVRHVKDDIMPDMVQRQEVIKTSSSVPLSISTKVKPQDVRGRLLQDGFPCSKYLQKAHLDGRLSLKVFGWKLTDPESTFLEDEVPIKGDGDAWRVLEPVRDHMEREDRKKLWRERVRAARQNVDFREARKDIYWSPEHMQTLENADKHIERVDAEEKENRWQQKVRKERETGLRDYQKSSKSHWWAPKTKEAGMFRGRVSERERASQQKGYGLRA